MINKIFIITFLLLSCNTLTAYELPKVNITKDAKPEIVLFTAKSVFENETKSYVITWKTINATHVQATYLGMIDLSGSVTITEAEYNRGAITLTASSIHNSYSDSKTINENSNMVVSPVPYTNEKKTRIEMEAGYLPYGYRNCRNRPCRRRY